MLDPEVGEFNCIPFQSATRAPFVPGGRIGVPCQVVSVSSRTILLADVNGGPSHAAALRCDGASHFGATRDWVGRGVCSRIQQRRREKGQVSTELAVGARLASLGSLAAVEKYSRLSLRRLSELKPQYSESKERPFGVY